MSAPNTCASGLTYFQDLAAGPGVNGAWTIQQLAGADTIEQAAAYYLRTIDADSADLTALKKISQTLGGVPSKIQMGFNVHIEYLTALYDTFGFTTIFKAPMEDGNSQSVNLRFKSAGFPVVTSEVWLTVRDSSNSVVFNEKIYTVDDNSAAFPVSHDFTGVIRVLQIAANNIEVYLDIGGGLALKYTSTDNDFAMGADAAISLSRQTTAAESLYSEVNDISYVGPAGLGTDCPVTFDAVLSSRGNLSADFGPMGVIADAALSSRGNLSADSDSDMAADYPVKALFVEGQFCLRGESDDTITQNENDYDMEEGPRCAVSNLTAAGGSWNLTGLQGGVKNRVLLLRNVGGGNNIVLKDLDGASAAENQFDLGGDATLTPGDSLLLIYTEYLSKWKKFPTL